MKTILQKIYQHTVDVAVVQEDMDKFKMWKKLKFDVLFVGDDWFKTPKWEEIEEKFKEDRYTLRKRFFDNDECFTPIVEVLDQVD